MGKVGMGGGLCVVVVEVGLDLGWEGWKMGGSVEERDGKF